MSGMAVNSPLVLLVDDEEQILFSYALALRSQGGSRTLTCTNGEDALKLLGREQVNVVILDLSMPVISGQELLRLLNEQFPHIPVIVMTGSGDTETVVSCMKAGAFDYLVKPVDVNRLVTTVRRACEYSGLRSELDQLKQHLLEDVANSSLFKMIITRNRHMRQLFRYAEAVAVSNQPVLISGETGVGKELFARAIHDASGRSGPFVAVNISGLDDTVFSDTVFGHRKGAFTGADTGREGLFARAGGGTLFLDEIGDLESRSQLKLLRVLQEEEFYPLGTDTPQKMLARVVVATNRNLTEMVANGTFRRDLYFRLCSHDLTIPPLRERLQDLPLLLEHFVAESAAALQKKTPPLPVDLYLQLARYDFPGNVRELKAMVHNAVAQHVRGSLTIKSFRFHSGQSNRLAKAGVPAPDVATGIVFDEFPTLKTAEERLISEAMTRAGGNQTRAAASLGISRQALSQRLQRQK